jgi:hypothetical protein
VIRLDRQLRGWRVFRRLKVKNGQLLAIRPNLFSQPI